jgi:hypothetical protein
MKNFKGTDHMGVPVANGRIILKWVLQKYGVKPWTYSNGSG